MTRQASSRLSAESQAIMDGQTAVKQLVKELYLKGETRLKIEMAVSKEIERTIAEIKDERLKKDTQISLARMAARCYDTLRSSAAFGDLAVLWAVVGLKGGTLKGRAKSNAERLIMTKTWKLPYGTQVQQRLRHYWKDVRETVDKLASERALDESDAAYGERRQSMRATAEIMVRQNRHIEEVESLKKRTKLVIGSTHADCSDRCAPYQGRVYSLDGTSGVTADGRRYVPLEEATNNPRDRYVTKAGRVYQNGFIYGFNCRHYLIEYADGLKPPTVNEQQRKREVAIDQRQRKYEREIIRAKEKAIANKDIDNGEYRKWNRRARELMKEYAKFSHDHGRPYYRSRVQLI